LNPDGLAAVVEANVMGALFSVFANEKYRKVMKSVEMPPHFGSGIDELMRHHPSLRPLGIQALNNTLRKLCRMGGLAVTEEEPKEESSKEKSGESSGEPASTERTVSQETGAAAPEEITSEGSASSSANEPAQPMEIATNNDMLKVPPFVDPEPDLDVDGSTLEEYIGSLGRSLETILANHEHSRSFTRSPGLDLMFQLHSLPKLLPSFPESSAVQFLTLAFRSLSSHSTPNLFRLVLERLTAKFQMLDSICPSWRDGSSFLDASGMEALHLTGSLALFVLDTHSRLLNYKIRPL